MSALTAQLEGMQILTALVYFLAVNFFGFCIFGLDKWKSKSGDWRIPENTLLTIALIGGSPAILIGRKFFRHKTRKQPFVNQLFAVVSVQILAILSAGIWIISS